jgi:serine/threonine protein kinase
MGSGYHETYDLYSPIAHLLRFYEEVDPISGELSMKVDSIPTKVGRFENEFIIVSKLGEGSFGEAFKVRHRFDGRLYAVKKSKE